ncbi:multiple sugar transport system substrate-binding protein [Cryobacterium sp. MP_M5]|uniref:ABC transporter substrate-binding protein n=1 Tax=unclassified Cryobacterium TaxID=2649013 RepID=UPI001A2023E0|nr:MULTISPECIES: sugar ABC transporter substrate-binding protein [unclassified Cryobacterium]MBG6059040.1 multiple sugar transport system substrate-binding protein [Cryobacterium sp. MP_M3]MEC5177334.1 multiple sugar transport system substrate-binding protein [Cryobacterium sp. MP_M5]
MKMNRVAILTLAAIPLVLTGCSTAASSDSASGTTLSYGLWDANQAPAYKQCAADFHKANPDITVKVEQLGWDDYWNKINTGFVSGENYDVFTSHLANFPEFMLNKQILPLDDYIKADGVDLKGYQPGLADLWKGDDGKQYGLPKDFDTIAMFYNKQLTDAAGLTADQLATLDWNPTDGGTYEKAIAHLTVDKNGVRGDEAGFDKANVATYGLWMENSGGSDGQTQWSFLAHTTGWDETNGAWGDKYNFDDPKFQSTIDWWYSLVEKGYMPSFEAQTGIGWSDQLTAGKVAMASNGSWMTGAVFGATSDTFTPAIAPTPVGPSGKRASMFNGLADNISATTKHPDQSWKWVKYLGSVECQSVVAKAAVVFPAIPAATDEAIAAFTAKGIDVSAFTTQVADGTTFLYSITDHRSDVSALVTPAMEAIMSGKAKASSLTAVNDQVNALFK